MVAQSRSRSGLGGRDVLKRRTGLGFGPSLLSRQQTKGEDLDLLVRDYLPTASKRLITLGPKDTIQEAARKLAPPGFDLLVIVDGAGKMIGVVTDSDIVGWVAGHEGQAASAATVSSIMSTKTTNCLPSQSLTDVAEMAQKNGRKHLPIVDEDGVPLGVVYVRDALMALLHDAEINERWLNAYFTGSI